MGRAVLKVCGSTQEGVNALRQAVVSSPDGAVVYVLSQDRIQLATVGSTYIREWGGFPRLTGPDAARGVQPDAGDRPDWVELVTYGLTVLFVPATRDIPDLPKPDVLIVLT
jgi:hypothetical protein